VSVLGSVAIKPWRPWCSTMVIAGLYLLAVLIVWPAGDFPLNDDWVYGEGARVFMETGRIQIPTSCNPCLLHVMLGGTIGKMFGFSYTNLRLLTLVMGLFAGLALNLLFREIGAGRKPALFWTLLYLFNPLVLSLCFSFMTDIAATGLTTAYMLYLFRGVRRDSRSDLVVASLMLTCAIGFRQGAALYAVSNLVVLTLYWLRRRHSWVLLVGLVALPALAALAAEAWLQQSDRVSEAYLWFKQLHHETLGDFWRRPGQGIFSMTVALGQVGCYYGLYCLPALLPFLAILPDMWRATVRLSPLSFTAAAAVVCTSLTKLCADGRLMPYNQNMLRVPQVGPPNLIGISMPLLKIGQRRLLTGVSGALAFMLFAALAAGLQRATVLCLRVMRRPAPPAADGQVREEPYRSLARAAIVAHCFTSLALGLLAVAFATVVMDVDRHYLFVLVPIFLCLCLTQRWLKLRALWWATLPALLAMIVYSTCAAQDYLSWNRARWQAARALESAGVRPASIDGGAEYNFFHDINLWVRTFKCDDPGSAPQAKWRWWRVTDDEYIISFSTIPNYDVVARHPYFSALAMRRLEVLTLHRVSPAGRSQPGGKGPDRHD